METSPVSKTTILLVDDEPLVLGVVSAILGPTYNLLTALSGLAGIIRANSYEGEISLLLSDFQMPGMSGLELATHVCKERPEMRVLLMSGFTDGMLILNEGWHFLPKPFIASQLKAIVATILLGGSPFDPSMNKG